MKNYAKQTQIETGKDKAAEATVRSSREIDLIVEELEQVIAPGSGVKR